MINPLYQAKFDDAKGGYEYAIKHPLWRGMDEMELRDAEQVFQHLAVRLDMPRAAGIAHAIRQIRMQRQKEREAV